MTPRKYRKKPVVIEACQFDGSIAEAESIIRWMVAGGYRNGVYQSVSGLLVIPTLEGEMTASPGDYIIRGVQGEFYPCKPDIFEQAYEESI